MSALRVATLNCRSLREVGRIEEVEDLLVRHNVGVCLLQETFLKPRISVGMAGYSLFRSDRVGARGGGTALAVRSSLPAMVVPIKELASLRVLEATAVMISLGGGRKLFCISVYNRSEHNRVSTELASIFNVLCLDRDGHEYVVGGDFNALHREWGFRNTRPRGRELFDFVESSRAAFGCRVVLSREPSRPLTGSFPDLYIVKDTLELSLPDDAVNELEVVSTTFSDHLMVLLDCSVAADDAQAAPRAEGRLQKLRRGVPSISADEFVRQLDSHRVLHGLGLEQVDSLASRSLSWDELNRVTESFTELVVGAMERSMREQSLRTGPRIPHGVRFLQREKRGLVKQLFSAFRALHQGRDVRSRIVELKRQIALVRNEIRREWREDQWRRNMQKLERVRSSMPRDFFKELRLCYQYKRESGVEAEAFLFDDDPASRRMLSATTPVELSNGRLLVTGDDVVQVLANVLEGTFNPAGCVPLSENPARQMKVQFGPDRRSDEDAGDDRFMTGAVLDRLIKNLKGKHSFGPDGVPSSVIKLLPAPARRILLIVINNSINLGRLPRLWKLSSVVFICKDKSVTGEVGNFRPISLLSNFAKLQERFFVDRLEREISDRDLISPNQFGFRRGLSTVHAIGTLLNQIQHCRYECQTVGVVFVDLKKAFDSVDHRLLIDRMRKLRIDENVVEYFEDFLAGREFISSRVMQSVVHLQDLHRVDKHSIHSGVLQGSIAGPVLFTLFIDEVLRRVPGTIAYADDLALIHGRADINILGLQLQSRFLGLQEVVESLRLSINMTKTKVVLFRDSKHDLAPKERTAIDQFQIRGRGLPELPGPLLEVVDSFCYLGVVLDCMLKFHLHVDRVVDSALRAYRGIARIVRLRGLQDSRKVWLYKAAVRPILTYGCPVWCLLAPFLMKRICQAEYHVLRAMFGRYRRRNGHFFSYRSRLLRASLPGVDYQIIKLARRHLIRLDGKECASVDQGCPRWGHHVDLIRRRLFVPESTIFVDALRILQDEQGNNVFYALDRGGLSGGLDLGAALDVHRHLRPMRRPTRFDLQTRKGIAPPWWDWQWPVQYREYRVRGDQ